MLVDYEDGVMLEEIFIEKEYCNNQIGTTIVTDILKENKVVYLWIFKDNLLAIKLYERFGFKIVEESKIIFEGQVKNI